MPIAEAWKFYRALKAMGKTVELDIHPRGGHVLNEPVQERAAMQRNLEWFKKWLVAPQWNWRAAPSSLFAQPSSDRPFVIEFPGGFDTRRDVPNVRDRVVRRAWQSPAMRDWQTGNE